MHKKGHKKVPKIVQLLLKVPKKGPNKVFFLIKVPKKHFKKHSWEFGTYMILTALRKNRNCGTLERVVSFKKEAERG